MSVRIERGEDWDEVDRAIDDMLGGFVIRWC